MNRRSALALLAGAAISGCRRAPRTLRTLRVASVPRFIIAPLYLADELGYFRDAGLQVDIQLLADTTQSIPLLAAGQIDITFGGATPAAFNAVAKGARIRIVAARDVATLGCTHEVHGHRKSFPNGFQDAAALKGKRVAVTAPTSLTAFLLDLLLESAGMQTSDVQLLTMRVSESTPALIAGRLDAVVDMDRTFSSPEIIIGPSVAQLLPGFQYSYAFFGPALLDGDAGVGVAFLRAYFRGVRGFRAGAVPRAVERLAEAGDMDREAIHTGCRDRLSQDGRIDRASVQRVIDWSVRKGFTPARMDASQMIDSRFVDMAVPPSEGAP